MGRQAVLVGQWDYHTLGLAGGRLPGAEGFEDRAWVNWVSQPGLVGALAEQRQAWMPSRAWRGDGGRVGRSMCGFCINFQVLASSCAIRLR